MSAWTNGNYTKKGLSLLSKLTQGNSLKITRAVTGTGYVSPSALADQTGVTGVKQTLLFKAASYPETGVCKLPMFLTNEGLASSYKARQIGIYALDPDHGEILYFISQSETGTEVPNESLMPEYSATWTFYFRYGQADNVNVTVDPSHTVSEDMLEEVRIIAETGVSTPELGEVLTLENTANLPFANLKLLGKTTQNGTPTPDAPVELVSAGNGGNLKVAVYGKNLLPYPYHFEDGTKGGITYKANADGSVTYNGTATAQVNPYFANKLLLRKGTYTISGAPKGSSWEKHLLIVQTGDYSTVLAEDNGNGKTFTLHEDANVNICFIVANGATVSNLTVYPMLVCGTTVAEYEAYKPVQTLTLSTPNGLPGIPVASGGNYRDADGQEWICDEIDLARGVYINRIESCVLDESSAFAKNSENESNSYLYFVRVENELGNTSVLCDRLKCKSLGTLNSKTASAENEGIQGGILSTQKDVIYVNLCAHTAANTVDSLKTFLADNPLKVQYALATPTETPLTANEIAAFKALTSNNPHTTIINDGGAYMEADCFLAQHEAAFKRAIEAAKGLEHIGQFELASSVDFSSAYGVYRISITETIFNLFKNARFVFCSASFGSYGNEKCMLTCGYMENVATIEMSLECDSDVFAIKETGSPDTFWLCVKDNTRGLYRIHQNAKSYTSNVTVELYR